MKALILFGSLLIIGIAHAQSPGGTSNCEIWSKVMLINSSYSFKDFGSQNKTIEQIGLTDMLLINGFPALKFNGSQQASFSQSLEELNTGTFFVVVKPIGFATTEEQSILHSEWKSGLQGVQENSFHLSSKFADRYRFGFNYPNTGFYLNALPSIKTLTWNDYNSRRIHRSYGSTEESKFAIGKPFIYLLPDNSTQNVAPLKAAIPEFVFFRHSLTENERLRVESYLAIKYGITLGAAADYLNSKNVKFWNKENNENFNNKIFGIGKDSNSDLLLTKSTSSHFPDFFTLSTNNIISVIPDFNHITLGDNGGAYNIFSQQPLASNITVLESIWLAQTSGSYANQISTNIELNASAFNPSTNEVIWFIVDRSATNTEVSDFTGTDVEFIQVPALIGGKIKINNFFFNQNQLPEISVFDQFTFGIGPKMVVAASLIPLECDDTEGTVVVRIIGGIPPYTASINGINGNNYTWGPASLSGSTFQTVLPLGWYEINATDYTGYSQTVSIEVSATPGISVDLGPDQILQDDETITLNAGATVTAEDVSYTWYKNDIVIENETQSTLLVSSSGIYKVKIENELNECLVIDDIMIFSENGGIIDMVLYPNPVGAGMEYSMLIALKEKDDITIEISDIYGKVISQEKMSENSKYYFKKSFKYSGVFFIKVKTSKDFKIAKVIVN